MNKGGAKKAAYDKAYNARPEEVANRVKRNQARAKLEKAGKVSKGDGKDVDHKNGNPMQSTKTNLRVQSPKANRSFPRTKNAGKK